MDITVKPALPVEPAGLVKYDSDIPFTGNRDVDISILLRLDDQRLESVCSVDRYSKSLCDEDRLWTTKLDKLYSGIVSLLPVNSNYRSIYNDIRVLNKDQILNWAAENGYDDVLLKLNILGSNAADAAIQAGRLDLLKIIDIRASVDGANLAARDGRFDILE